MIRFSGRSAPGAGAGPFGHAASFLFPWRIAAANDWWSCLLRPGASWSFAVSVGAPAAPAAAGVVDSAVVDSGVAVATGVAGTTGAVAPVGLDARATSPVAVVVAAEPPDGAGVAATSAVCLVSAAQAEIAAATSATRAADGTRRTSGARRMLRGGALRDERVWTVYPSAGAGCSGARSIAASTERRRPRGVRDARALGALVRRAGGRVRNITVRDDTERRAAPRVITRYGSPLRRRRSVAAASPRRPADAPG